VIHARLLLINKHTEQAKYYEERLKAAMEACPEATSEIALQVDIDAAIAQLEERPTLFDIVVMDDIQDLQKLRAAHHYIPIVICSIEQPTDHQVLLGAIKAGAHSFVTLPSIGETESDRESETAILERIGHEILNLVDRYLPFRHILDSPLEIGSIRKKGDTKKSILGDQIAFLEYVQKNKPRLRMLFPEVRKSWTEDEQTYLEIPQFRMESLRMLIFDETDPHLCLENALTALNEILDIVFSRLYSENQTHTIPRDFVDKMHFEKFDRRTEEVGQLLESMRKRKSTPAIDALDRLLSADVIVVGDRKLRNPKDIVEDLRNSEESRRLMLPPSLCMIHGDLHFDNILVDYRLPKEMRFKLIDPRGMSLSGCRPGTGDIAYDLGKLLHSSHGLYDFIHAGYLVTDLSGYSYDNDKRIVEVPTLKRTDWATVEQRGGGSGAIMTSHKQLVEPWTFSVFQKLDQRIRQYLSVYEEGHANDRNLMFRAEFCEAMQFCTMTPFHLTEDVVRTLSIHIRGIELLNQFCDRYHDILFPPAYGWT
jgi:hypothetical protein